MDKIVVTLKHQIEKKPIEVDIALPVTVPFHQLTDILTTVIPLPDLQDIETTSSITGRVITSGQLIRPHETLAQAGVVDGDIVELVVSRKVQPKELPLNQEYGSYLQCLATGKRFVCRGRSMLIGRLRHLPINLTGLPGDEAVSRTHANIINNEGYWIKDERSTNGTLVDGVKLQPGERMLIRHGSQIQFGVDGPILVFHSSFAHAE